MYRSTWSLVTAILLLPMTALVVDILGAFGLNAISPRGDFGLWASNVTLSVCYVIGAGLVWRWIVLNEPTWGARIIVAVVSLPLYTFQFAFWTFLNFPFGRISNEF